MISEEKKTMLVKAARLYYEEDRSQAEISKIMNISRPYVSKLLKLAKNLGIVEIRIIDPEDPDIDCQNLESALCTRYRLERAIIVSDDGEKETVDHALGEAAACYLHSILRDGDRIATSWGNTMYTLSKELLSEKSLKDLLYVQLCGGISSVHSAVHANEIATAFSNAWNCRAYLLQAPAIVRNRELREMLMQEPDLRHVMEYAEQANVAVFTVGSFGMDNALVQAGYLSKDEMQRLIQEGAVGDLCAHVLNREGKICDMELDGRTVALSLEALKEKKYRICVANGKKKTASIEAALHSQIMNVLITDRETAEQLL